MAEPQYSARNFVFYENQDEESLRRSHLPRLNPYSYSKYVRYDLEGYIYVSHWIATKSIPEDAKILGSHQEWRDYSSNPPKLKRYYRHSFDQIKGGIDIALRRHAIDIADKYRSDGRETNVVLATLKRVGELRKELTSMNSLKDEDLERIFYENRLFLLGQPGYQNPKLPEKEKTVKHLQAGLLDKKGRRNTGGLMMRLFAVELAQYKRWEGSFPPILGKQASIIAILELERDFARANLSLNLQKLEDASTSIPEGGVAGKFEQILFGISRSLTDNVVIRPYCIEAREVEGILGAGGIRIDRLNVMEAVRGGQVNKARELLVQGRTSLQTVLEKYADFKTVEKGVRPLANRVNLREEVQMEMPFIFRH